jgi:hypothetical protein
MYSRKISGLDTTLPLNCTQLRTPPCNYKGKKEREKKRAQYSTRSLCQLIGSPIHPSKRVVAVQYPFVLLYFFREIYSVRPIVVKVTLNVVKEYYRINVTDIIYIRLMVNDCIIVLGIEEVRVSVIQLQYHPHVSVL